MRCVAQLAFEVVERRHHAEVPPDPRLFGEPQPACLFGIERPTAPCDPAECLVHHTPVHHILITRSLTTHIIANHDDTVTCCFSTLPARLSRTIHPVTLPNRDRHAISPLVEASSS